MDIQRCTVYVRAYRRTTVQVRRTVTIGEVADIAAPPRVKAKIDTLKIFYIPDSSQKGKFVITIIDIINAIWKTYPYVDVQSVGDSDIVIDYVPKPIKQHTLWEWIKVFCVCTIVFAGATIAIMTYNTDTSLAKTFVILNRIFTGKEVENPMLLTIPYSIGIAFGIIIFFNHIGFKKVTEDPTPMQVEINKYETDIENSEIDSITNKRRGEP